jgi:flavin-binding protein dodecin
MLTGELGRQEKRPKERRWKTMPRVARITEVIAGSPVSFDDAVKVGFERARKTLRGITGIRVLEQRVRVADDKMVEYRVRMEIIFVLENWVSLLSAPTSDHASQHPNKVDSEHNTAQNHEYQGHPGVPLEFVMFQGHPETHPAEPKDQCHENRNDDAKNIRIIPGEKNFSKRRVLIQSHKNNTTRTLPRKSTCYWRSLQQAAGNALAFAVERSTDSPNPPSKDSEILEPTIDGLVKSPNQTAK